MRNLVYLTFLCLAGVVARAQIAVTLESPAQCHANATPESAADDYLTFSIKVTTTPVTVNAFTVTATQGGNPLAVTLSNGSPATAVNCGLTTPLRSPAGSAGKGNITLTITDNVTSSTQVLTVVDPGPCAVVCEAGTPTTVMYEYTTQTDITELDALPIIIPRFDTQAGTRTLTSVKLDYTVGGKTAFIFENRAAQAQNFKAGATSEAVITLNGNQIASNTLTMSNPLGSIAGGVLVPASGSWPGDSIQAGVPSTLLRMASWVSDYLSVFKDPRTDPRWVTNATGNAGDDADMKVLPLIQDSKSGTLNYTAAGDLAPFTGTGNVPLDVSTLSGFSLSGGGGNIASIQRTRGFASAKVTYTYTCVDICVKPTISVKATDPTCTTAGKLELTGSNGDKYGISNGTAYTGPAYATATAVPGSFPVTIKGNISNAADSTFTIRVFNKKNDCFKDTTVTVKAAPVKPTVTVKTGFPACRENGTSYTIKFAKTPGSAVVTARNVATGAAIAVTADSIANIPVATASVRLIVTSADGCRDSITVAAPNCVVPCVKPDAGPDQTIACTDNKLPTSLQLKAAKNGEKYKVLGSVPAGANISVASPSGSVTGTIVAGTYNFILQTQADSVACRDTVKVVVEPCETPTPCVKPVIGTITTKKATCVPGQTGSNSDAGFTVSGISGGDKYSFATTVGGLAPYAGATTLTGNSISVNNIANPASPSGQTYFVRVYNGATDCFRDTTLTVSFIDCGGNGQLYDLALEKAISKKLAMLGDTLTYLITVTNQGQGDATGVEVTDPLNAGIQYVSNSTATGSYSPTTKVWNIGSLAVGASATLTIKVKVVAQGVWFNTAEITRMNEKDEDSTPGNGVDGEDDIDRECFTVPVKVCKGDGSAIELTVPAQYTGVVWFRKTQGGIPVQVATGNTYTAKETELGTYEYTYTSTAGTCPAGGCCPIILVVEDCCPVQVCVPFTVRKVKIK